MCARRAAGHQAADFGLETAVGKCLILRIWIQASVSAALAHAAGAVPSWTAGAHCAPLRKDGCGEKKHAPGGRLAAAPTEDMEHGTWGAAGHQAADFGLETAVGKCLILRIWIQAGVSAALHMRPAQCHRERRAHTVRPYGRTDTGRRSMRPAGGWQPPLRRAETIVPSSFYRIRCPGLRFCGRLRRREKGGQAHGEDKLGAPRPPATKNSQ